MSLKAEDTVTGVLDIDGGFFWIQGLTLPGLEGPIPGSLIDTEHSTAPLVLGGVAMGPVALTLERWAARPDDDLSAWEDVVEIDGATGGPLLAATSALDPIGLSLECDFPAGDRMALRVCARDRDVDQDLVVSDPTGDYKLQIWPVEGAQSPGATVLKASSSSGKAWVRRHMGAGLPAVIGPQERKTRPSARVIDTPQRAKRQRPGGA